MTDFSDVFEFLNSVENAGAENHLTQFEREKINRLRGEYLEIPSEFLDYLNQIGAGSLNDCRYMVYGDLLGPSDIFNSEDVEGIEDLILLFGDDFAGNPAGFLVKDNWRIAEILHENKTLFETDLTFGQFIRQRIGMNDEQE